MFITTSDQLNESRSDSNYGITSDSCLPTAQDIEFLFFFTEIKLALRQKVGHIFLEMTWKENKTDISTDMG